MVLRFTPDGQDRHVVATGIRNCVSLAVRPGSDALYCVTNERDALGDNLVPDYFTQVKDGQFFGWPWGKFRRPASASRFHVVMILSLVVALGILFTGVDPVQVTEFSVVFSAIALPLTYLPILIVANDPKYMGERVNGKVTNVFGLIYLGIILIASIAAIPLMIVTGAGA